MTDPDSAATTGRPGGRSGNRWLTVGLSVVIAVGLLLAGGGLTVALGIGRTGPPASDSVEAGFARDMALHHRQAVEMANLALLRTEDAEVRQLAFDISATQTNQLGRMQGWLSLWDLPRTDGEVMAWMGGAMEHSMDHAGHDAAVADGAIMPGMATETELAELRQLSGTAFDVRFLQLMTRHHQGGLEMAEYARDHATVPAVQRLAESIAATQAAETTTMEAMIRERGGTPLPAP
ncbi:DUF305 domain-containing protein [Modestobacter lapidis]|nr:DUF305 domain-containing protein [Modestobacter lapidis]